MDWIVQIVLFSLLIGLIGVSTALILHIKQSKSALRELKNEIRHEMRIASQELLLELDDKKKENSAPEFDEREINGLWVLAELANKNGRSASLAVRDLIDAKRILRDTRKYKTRQEYPVEYYAGPDGKLTRYLKM